MLPQPSDIRAI